MPGWSVGKQAAGGIEDGVLGPSPSPAPSTDSQQHPHEQPGTEGGGVVAGADDATARLPLPSLKRDLGDDSALRDTFEAREEFAGARPGFVYRLGSLGLGYYADVRVVV